MAFNWIAAFKVIPWRDVLVAAPVVAASAKKLWTAVRKQNAAPATDVAHLDPADRLGVLEAQVAELRREQAASAELIQSLADQNVRLVKAVDVLRFRTWILLAGCVLLACAVVVLGMR